MVYFEAKIASGVLRGNTSQRWMPKNRLLGPVSTKGVFLNVFNELHKNISFEHILYHLCLSSQAKYLAFHVRYYHISSTASNQCSVRNEVYRCFASKMIASKGSRKESRQAQYCYTTTRQNAVVRYVAIKKLHWISSIYTYMALWFIARTVLMCSLYRFNKSQSLVVIG